MKNLLFGVLCSRRHIKLNIANRLSCLAVVTVILGLLLPINGLAQAISGDLTGTVFDSSGAAIPGATVVATHDATGVKTTATANGDGVYRFSNLPIGRYTVSGSASGFSSDDLKNVDIALNNTATANLTLKVGSVGTTVEVSAAAAVIDTTTAQLQNTFDSHEVLELPQTGSGSGVYNLALLGAGVSTSGGVGQGFGPAVAGQRPDNNSFNLDGISNNNYYDPAPLVYVSNEAIGEFTLLQNQFAPEFGGG
jgi:LPXTG-motif cell wall-anchored protein